MPTVALYNTNGEQVGEVELKEDIFGVPVHGPVLHDAVVMQLAGRRRGTHDTKTRAEVQGGGRKPWRQKGTGRARHGTIRSPIWRGGGVVFGPHPRDYSYSLPKKVRRLALKSALSAKVQAGDLLVLEELSLEQPRTKDMVKILNPEGKTPGTRTTTRLLKNRPATSRTSSPLRPQASMFTTSWPTINW